MKLKQRWLAGLLALVLLLCLPGCGAAPEKAAPAPDDSAQDGSFGEVAQSGIDSAARMITDLNRFGGLAEGAARLREPFVDTKTAESATVMMYLVGSDLESAEGMATNDLEEIMRADLGEHVNVVIQTMGCHKWHNDAVSPAATQRFTVENGELVCQEPDLEQLDSTAPETLRDFIQYCAREYPADRNILILWDHGGGPVYGFGYDEYRSAASTLTLDEMQTALDEAGVKFDFIGFDACLMGCMETAVALSDYADYLIASEDFISGYGWEYQYWLTELGDDVTMPTAKLGRTIVDTFVTESEQARTAGIMTLADLQYAQALYDAWWDYAQANQEALTAQNYSWATENTGRGYFSGWIDGNGEYAMSEYYITDLMALASTLECRESAALVRALQNIVVYSASTDTDSDFTGLSVTLPYGDAEFYKDLTGVFTACGFDSDYVAWLEAFTVADGSDDFYDSWSEWQENWDNSTYFGGWAGHTD